jgi:hypothetical protein
LAFRRRAKTIWQKGTPFFSALPFHRTKNYWLWYMCKKNMFFSTPPFRRAKNIGSGACAKKMLFFSTPPFHHSKR